MTCQKDGQMESAFPTPPAATSTSTSAKPTVETTPSVLTSPISATDSSNPTAKDCDGIWNQGHNQSGIYEIQPEPTCTSKSSFNVVCDLETSCGGWLVFQRRFDGSVNFTRGWDDYKDGFGDLSGEFWLGLEKLHRLTKYGRWKLRVELEDFYGNTTYAEYGSLFIGDKSIYYRLYVGSYSGLAGDSLRYNANMAFSTIDNDHDRYIYSCAQIYQGGWWYSSCYGSVIANLNGPYTGSPTSTDKAMTWYTWKNKNEPLKKSEMKIKRVG